MGREGRPDIQAERIEDYLTSLGYQQVRVVELSPLGGEGAAGKEYGYGRPLAVDFEAGGRRRRMVLRTMSPDPFGHGRRADRVAEMVLSADTFASIPRHVQPRGVGTFGPDGALVPMAPGEPWLLTEHVEGRLYADDLQTLARTEEAGQRDLDRARALADYLAGLHAERAEPAAWRRALRDAVGSGEGIFGLTDSYPDTHPVAPAARVKEIEAGTVRFRWKLKGRERRASRVHGDFHPFNLLFREGTDFSVLDCSRGAAGEPADDVTALTINYLFFALLEQDRFDGALRALWDTFYEAYLVATGDRELLEVVAPFFAWRALVVASPVWYPEVADGTRDRLLSFAEALVAGRAFDPTRVDGLLP